MNKVNKRMCEPQYSWRATIQESPDKYQKSLLPTSTRSLKMGKFEDVTDEVLEGLNSDTDEEEEQDQ